MKIIDNAKKQNFPPFWALYDAPSDTLYLYAFARGIKRGMKAAWKRGRFVEDVAICSRNGGDANPSDWIALPTTKDCFRGCLHDVLSAIVDYMTTQADDTQADDTQADDTQADDTQADDTQADDAQADTAQADTAQASTVVRSYRRKVSCAGDPATAIWCVVFFAGGQQYIRAYQSRGRAAAAFHRYHIGRVSSAFLLYRGLDTWHMASCVVDRSLWDSVPYSETGLLVERAISLANKYFSVGGV